MAAAPTGSPSFPHAEVLRDCVHCGLCLNACPTYLELGTEADSPRGRIYLMQALAAGEVGIDATVTQHLDLCLGCRACETACPSGVRYGQALEDARAVVRAAGPRSWRKRVIDILVPALFTRPRLFALALAPLRWLEAAGILPRLRRASRWARLLPPLQRPVSLSGQTFQPQANVRGEAILFEGCVARVLFGATNEATVRALTNAGYAVEVPRAQGCCGALSLHSGARDAARELARHNIDALPGDAPVVVNIAGCGAALREYDVLLADDPAYAERARRFSARIRDVSEFLAETEFGQPCGELPLRVAYHDACHLAHAQGIRAAPRALLRRIPGLELVELEESDLCCGAAGTYNLTEPAMAARLGQRKARHIAATGATVVAAANPGCAMQIRAALDASGRGDVEVLHPIEILDRANAAERPT